jgi:hypothetical protein
MYSLFQVIVQKQISEEKIVIQNIIHKLFFYHLSYFQ